MASTYVNDLRLNEMATGDGSGTWGTTTNTNLELIAEAFSYGTEVITTNADTHTTTIADGATDPGRSLYLKYTGTLDSACTITIGPNTVSKVWIIENGTSGSQDIILSQGSGANITIPAGDTKVVYSDGAGAGAAFVDAFASLSVVDLKVQDDLTVTGDIDVDGTTNLDVVDIDGAVDMASTALVTGVLTANGGAVFNETGADVDFRVESDTVDHALFVQGSDGFVGIGTSSPNVGIGTSSPSAPLDVTGVIKSASATQSSLYLSNAARTTGFLVGRSLGSNNAQDFFIYDATAAATRLAIDSSGNVGIGATVLSDALDIQRPSGTASRIRLLQTGYDSWQIGMPAADGAFTFANSGTERLRIDSNGNLLVGATSGSKHIISKSVASGGVLEIINTSATVPAVTAFKLTGAAPNNGTSTFFTTSDTSAYRGGWLSNGGVQNYQGNNSNLSDEREKKNIEDLSSTWDCVKSWNLRKFHYNEDEDSDDKRLGVIAQEVEAECPEVITEWQKQEQKDEVLWTEEDELPEGVSVGDVKTAAQEEIMRKGVKEQQMYWMAIKALQEAMTEIEDLKARITTLENA
jgi:hypothetical protein